MKSFTSFGRTIHTHTHTTQNTKALFGFHTSIVDYSVCTTYQLAQTSTNPLEAACDNPQRRNQLTKAEGFG